MGSLHSPSHRIAESGQAGRGGGDRLGWSVWWSPSYRRRQPAPTIANGFAGYTPGTTSPPNQFNALTLVSGGAASVNTASLTIVTQPASGTATVHHQRDQRHHHLHAGIGHHRRPDPDLRLLRPGRHLPERRQLHHRHHDLPPSTGQYFGGQVEGDNRSSRSSRRPSPCRRPPSRDRP